MRRRVLALLLAFGGVTALLAMHGVSAHGLAHDHAGEASSPGPDIASDANHDHNSDHHDGDDHGGAPCQCPHGAAALCALIVLGLAVIPRRTTCRVFVRAATLIRPPFRVWTPDPPVPKLALVFTSM